MTIDSGALVALSNDLAATVERVADGVVAVEARSRIGSSGFFIRPDLILTADHALEIAPPDALRVGAIALAVARDDDGDLAASMGVVSAVGGAWRTWQGGEIDRCVRPDLSLYPRFSGSPLVDVGGRVLGLNTGGLSRRQVVTVPGTTIQRVVDALLTRGGRIPRGYLGVARKRSA